jgi:CHASE3 domain sensor protein
LHIQEELKQSTGTLNRLTMVLIGVTIVLAVLTTLLYLKAH